MRPASYGELSVLLAMEFVGSSVVMLGQDRALLRYVSTTPSPDRLLLRGAALWGVTASSLVFLSISLGGATIRSTLHLRPEFPLILVGLGIIPLGIHKLFVSSARGQLKNQRFGRAVLGVGAVRSVGGVVAVLVGFGVRGFAVVSVAVYTTAAVVELAIVSFRARDEAQLDDHTLASSFFYGLPFIVEALGGQALLYFDRFLLQHYESAQVVGQYSFASLIVGSIGLLHALVIAGFEPYLYKRTHDSDTVRTLLALYMVMIAAMSTIGAITVIVGSRELATISWLAGRLGGASYLPILAAAALCGIVSNQAYMRLAWCRKSGFISSYTVAAAAVNVGLNLVLVPLYGAFGAAMAALGGAVFGAGLASMVAHWVVPRLDPLRSELLCMATIGGGSLAIALAWGNTALAIVAVGASTIVCVGVAIRNGRRLLIASEVL